MAAGARRPLVLRGRPHRRTGARVSRAHAILRRRRSRHWLRGRMRDKLSRSARPCRLRPAHPPAAGRRDSAAQRDLSQRKTKRCDGQRCSRCRQHRCCCNWTSFPAVIHTLSTDFYLCKLHHVFHLPVFHLLHVGFHFRLRLSFSLFSRHNSSYSCQALRQFHRQFSPDLPQGFRHNLRRSHNSCTVAESAQSGHLPREMPKSFCGLRLHPLRNRVTANGG